MLESLDELYGFGHQHGADLSDRVNALTHDDINRVLTTFFAKQNPISVRVSPEFA